MGYSVSIKPNDNFDKFRTNASIFDTARYIKKYLEYRVMSHGKKDLKDFEVITLVMDFEKQVDKLVELYVDKEKAILTSQFDDENPEYREKGELTFSGWEFSESEPVDLQDVKEYVINQLFILTTLTKDYDYYDESEQFSQKDSEFLELMDYLQDECAKSVDIEVINYYEESNHSNEPE